MTYSLCLEYIGSITLENETENKRVGFLRLAHLSGVAISHKLLLRNRKETLNCRYRLIFIKVCVCVHTQSFIHVQLFATLFIKVQ